MRSGSLPSTAHDRRHRLPRRERPERAVRARTPRAPGAPRRERGRRAAAERIILPGVGAARATIDSLVEQDLVGALTDRVQGDGVPFLGICIGLQVLFDHSEEGDTTGLGWVPGDGQAVPRRPGACPRSGGTRCASPGRTRSPTGCRPGATTTSSTPTTARPTEPADALGITDYTVEFCSVVARDNVVATQFHAEKSGPLGLALLRNFAAWEPAC